MSSFEVVEAVVVVDVKDKDARGVASGDADSVAFVLVQIPEVDLLEVCGCEVLPSVERRPFLSWLDRHDPQTLLRVFECRLMRVSGVAHRSRSTMSRTRAPSVTPIAARISGHSSSSVR